MQLLISAPNKTLHLPRGVERCYMPAGDLSDLDQIPHSFMGLLVIDREGDDKTALNEGPLNELWSLALDRFAYNLRFLKSARRNPAAYYDLIHTRETTDQQDLAVIRWNNLALMPLADRQDFLTTACYPEDDYDTAPWSVPCIDTAVQMARIQRVQVFVMMSWRYFGGAKNLHPQPDKIFERNLRTWLRPGVDGLIMFCGRITNDGDEYFCRQSVRDPAAKKSDGQPAWSAAEQLEIRQSNALYHNAFRKRNGEPDDDAINAYCAGEQLRAIGITQRVFAELSAPSPTRMEPKR